MTVRPILAYCVMALGCRGRTEPALLDAGSPPDRTTFTKPSESRLERIRGVWRFLPPAAQALVRQYDEQIRDGGREAHLITLRSQRDLQVSFLVYELKINQGRFTLRSSDGVIEDANYAVVQDGEPVIIDVERDGIYRFFLADGGDTVFSPEIAEKYGDGLLRAVYFE